jgi:acetyl esterase/lipase
MKSVHSRSYLLLALLASFSTLAAESPDDVQVTADIVYATYGARQLKVDIYRPQPASKPLPGIVVIRGGGWKQGDKQGFAPIARNLAAKGFVTACIEYRVLPEVQFPDPVYDTKAAVRWMRAEGRRYGIATDSIGAIGGSAGGHLVALLGTTYEVAALEGDGGHAGVSSRVQAVVALAPVTNFVEMGNAAQTLFHGDIDMASRFAPLAHVTKGSAPILFIHGDADKTVPILQSQAMLTACKRAGVRASLITLKGAPHGFWHQPTWAADTITQAAAFFHDVLGR